MNTHTPDDNPRPLTDIVAGDPPVPLTVWRTVPTGGETGTPIPARLAYRIVAGYSRPGDTVIDLTDTLAATCAIGRRPHQRAWFADHTTLTVDPPVTVPTGRPAGNDDLLDIATWFGDDLHDGTPARTEPERPAATYPSGAAGLFVACWPFDHEPTTNRVRLAFLLSAAVGHLHTGGCLILVITPPTGQNATPEDYNPIITAAQQTGLTYLQHIVAVTADTDGDSFTYHADEELLALAHTGTTSHRRAHTDLLVFIPTPSRRQGRRHA